MSVSLDEVVERKIVPARDEEHIERRTSQAEFPCENKLGFAALCGDCYMVRLLGTCPKQRLEQPPLSEDTIAGQPAAESALDMTASPAGNLDLFRPQFGFILPESTSSALESARIQGEETQAVMAQATVSSADQLRVDGRRKPEKTSAKMESKVLAQRERKKPLERSYLELLFDDAVDVVIANPRPVQRSSTPYPTTPTVLHPEKEPAPINVALKERESSSEPALQYQGQVATEWVPPAIYAESSTLVLPEPLPPEEHRRSDEAPFYEKQPLYEHAPIIQPAQAVLNNVTNYVELQPTRDDAKVTPPLFILEPQQNAPISTAEYSDSSSEPEEISSVKETQQGHDDMTLQETVDTKDDKPYTAPVITKDDQSETESSYAIPSPIAVTIERLMAPVSQSNRRTPLRRHIHLFMGVCALITLVRIG